MTSQAAAFLASTPQSASASDSWAERYGRELRGIVTRYAGRLPRQVQQHLGPSELGHECDRSVVAKMAGCKVTNHVSDPWPSIQGTALHSFFADAFNWDNDHNGYLRWLTEARVTPDPGPGAHPGTADLYDIATRSVVDWKFQGDSTRARLRSLGPPRHYYVQILLYRLGYLNLGFPVDRVVIVSVPRTRSTLDEVYVWSHVPTAEDDQLVREVLVQTAFRQEAAQAVRDGRLSIMDIPAKPDDSECFWCGLYRPQAAYDGLYGCPGTLSERRKRA
jgi:hypothetical protein